MNKIWHATIPVTTKSEMNLREHWSKRSARSKTQKEWIKFFFLKDDPQIELPCNIKLSRVAPRVLDDDNLRPALKACRDCIADLIIPGLKPGRADSDPRITWEYEQKKGKMALEILIYN